MGPQELAIYRWLKDNADRGNPKTPATIAEMVSLPGNTVRTLLGRMVDKNLLNRSVGNSYFVNVADVAPVAGVASVADVAGERNKAQHERNIEMLRPSTPLESPKKPLIEGAQQAQHDSHGATEELFTAETPPGLTPKQWENAKWFWGTGQLTDFRQLADQIGLGYHKLKALIEERKQ
jgi:DNA-binding MarR family transcriptional regulator